MDDLPVTLKGGPLNSMVKRVLSERPWVREFVEKTPEERLEVAKRYLYGVGVPKNEPLGALLAEFELLEHENAEAWYISSQLAHRDLSKYKSPESSFKALRTAAQLGHPAAAAEYGEALVDSGDTMFGLAWLLTAPFIGGPAMTEAIAEAEALLTSDEADKARNIAEVHVQELMGR